MLQTSDNVSVYYRTDVCAGKDVVFIKVVNSNQRNSVVSWKLWAGAEKNTIAVDGNSTTEGICPSAGDENLLTDLIDYVPAGLTIRDMNADITVQ